jgi:hypothetical protein
VGLRALIRGLGVGGKKKAIKEKEKVLIIETKKPVDQSQRALMKQTIKKQLISK